MKYWGEGPQGKLLQGSTVSLTNDKEGTDGINQTHFSGKVKISVSLKRFKTYTHLITKDTP